MQAPGPVAAEETPPTPPAKRDWVAWYEGLSERERRELRGRLVLAPPDEVRNDDELRHFFLFHVDDLAEDQPPGTRRLLEFYHIVNALRGREEMAAERKKIVLYMLAEYQHYLRDNPFTA